VLSSDSKDPTSTSWTLTISDVDTAETFVAQTGTKGHYAAFSIDAAGCGAI
jgi:VCBS repeat-containing protein